MERQVMRPRSSVMAALVLAATVTSCSSGSGGSQHSYPYPAAPGTAVEVGQPPQVTGFSAPVIRSAGSTDDGLPDTGTLSLPDGSILSCNTDRFRVASFTPGPKPLSITNLGVRPTLPEADDSYVYGFARTPDGQIYLGWDGVLFSARSPRLDDLTPLSAQTPAKPRAVTDPTPAAAEAAAFRFSDAMRPIGVRPDGSVIILDGNTLWAYKSGRLTRLLEPQDIPSSAVDPSASRVTSLGAVAAVDAQGTIWFAPGHSDSGASLKDVIGLTPEGAVTPLKLPPMPPQIPALSHTVLTALTPDGNGGFYTRIGETLGRIQQVLHVTPTKATIIAQSAITPDEQAHQSPPNFGGKVDALKIPLFLPTGIAVQSGQLILIGGTNYVIAVGLPKD